MARTKSQVHVSDLTGDDVVAYPIHDRMACLTVGHVVVLFGEAAELRAVLHEADRQLARLEVEHRIDQATSDEGTGQ